MKEKDRMRSRRLSETDMNLDIFPVPLKTYWCRVAYGKFETYNAREHWHSFFELHLCLTGSSRFLVDEKEYVLAAGEYLLLPPYRKHRICEQGEDFSKFVWGFAVKEEKIAEELKNGYDGISLSAAPERMISAVEILLENMNEEEFEFYPVLKGQLYYIFVQLVRAATQLKTEGSFAKSPSAEMDSIRKFISNNLSNDLRPEEIAAQFYRTVGQIDRLCRTECHCSVSQLKRQLQAEKMRDLLGKTDLSLKEIAEQTGFSDQYAMSKFFRKMEGESPGRYRRSMKR